MEGLNNMRKTSKDTSKPNINELDTWAIANHWEYYVAVRYLHESNRYKALLAIWEQSKERKD